MSSKQYKFLVTEKKTGRTGFPLRISITDDGQTVFAAEVDFGESECDTLMFDEFDIEIIENETSK